MKEYVIDNMTCPISYFMELYLYIDDNHVNTIYQEYKPSKPSSVDTADKMFYIT